MDQHKGPPPQAPYNRSRLELLDTAIQILQEVSLLRPLLREQDVDVALLSETILKPTDIVKFPGYNGYRQDEHNQNG
ncbi:putative endonuclease and reverse transcriptase-like protein [Operophtera brumata]|uniref:Putative endonuclease and reverse transcriptase-like protein n=1 Tax=Operophtera brumata TaxID=104452 RepID=A0A0L7KT59_OPEBR|nr:putative endonuclease and reverse transcriptase-like protein [Operophtera brumata]